MTAGKGYLALAALIFAKWRPIPALFACLLFAFTDAVQVRLQGVPLPIVGEVPTQAIQALPYIATVLLLAGFVGRAVAPKAIGQPYVKGAMKDLFSAARHAFERAYAPYTPFPVGAAIKTGSGQI